MASRSTGSDGVTSGRNRPTASPSLDTSHFSKFQVTSPALPSASGTPVSSSKSGARSGPLTSTFSSIGNVTPYVAEQNSAISSAVPGSWPPNWLHGTPMTVIPGSSSCSCSSSVYCGVRPHFDATLTTSAAVPPVSAPSVVVSPDSVCTFRSYRDTDLLLERGELRARAGTQHLRWQGPTHEALGLAGGFEHRVEVDAGVDTHVLDHVHEVLGADVAGRARRVRAAAEPTDGGVVVGDTELQRREHVGQPGAPGVVEVQVERGVGEGHPGLADQRLHPARRGHARGVAVRDAVGAVGQRT